mmetsp:Transcript_1931/g.5328  ORF Transcript_1931/g.5328 Transcript_1931/m.5328 type:complete len:210 (-) Transcript_1931:559-1188(-)
MTHSFIIVQNDNPFGIVGAGQGQFCQTRKGLHPIRRAIGTIKAILQSKQAEVGKTIQVNGAAGRQNIGVAQINNTIINIIFISVDSAVPLGSVIWHTNRHNHHHNSTHNHQENDNDDGHGGGAAAAIQEGRLTRFLERLLLLLLLRLLLVIIVIIIVSVVTVPPFDLGSSDIAGGWILFLRENGGSVVVVMVTKHLHTIGTGGSCQCKG